MTLSLCIAFGTETTEDDKDEADSESDTEKKLSDNHSDVKIEVQEIRRLLAAEKEMNKVLIDEKKNVEGALNAEITKWTNAQERVAFLEREHASKEKSWKANEHEYQATIKTLKERLQDQQESNEILPASAFAQIMSSKAGGESW